MRILSDGRCRGRRLRHHPGADAGDIGNPANLAGGNDIKPGAAEKLGRWLLGGLLLSPLIGGAPITSGNFDIRSLLVSFLGAIILLAIVNLFRRGRVR